MYVCTCMYARHSAMIGHTAQQGVPGYHSVDSGIRWIGLY